MVLDFVRKTNKYAYFTISQGLIWNQCSKNQLRKRRRVSGLFHGHFFTYTKMWLLSASRETVSEETTFTRILFVLVITSWSTQLHWKLPNSFPFYHSLCCFNLISLFYLCWYTWQMMYVLDFELVFSIVYRTGLFSSSRKY